MPRGRQAVQPGTQSVTVVAHRPGGGDLLGYVRAGGERIVAQVVDAPALGGLHGDADRAGQRRRMPGEIPVGGVTSAAGVVTDDGPPAGDGIGVQRNALCVGAAVTGVRGGFRWQPDGDGRTRAQFGEQHREYQVVRVDPVVHPGLPALRRHDRSDGGSQDRRGDRVTGDPSTFRANHRGERQQRPVSVLGGGGQQSASARQSQPHHPLDALNGPVGGQDRGSGQQGGDGQQPSRFGVGGDEEPCEVTVGQGQQYREQGQGRAGPSADRAQAAAPATAPVSRA